jgi:Flp pilus assembly protein TadD
MSDLISALGRHPDNVSMIRAAAERLHQLGRTEKARSYYEQLVRLRPDDHYAFNNLANLLDQIDNESAFKAARRAYELAPNDPSILDTYGWALVQIGDLDKGLALLREAVARNGRSAVTRYHLGVALEEYGSSREAKRQIKEALSLNASARWSDDAMRRLERLR